MTTKKALGRMQFSTVPLLDSRALRDLLHISSNQLCDRRRRGLIPEPDIRLSKRTFLWRQSTIDAWLASCSPASQEELA